MASEQLNSEFYEDAGDLLADFRKLYRGGAIDKNGKDPFDKDIDVIQSVRETKLRDQENNNRM